MQASSKWFYLLTHVYLSAGAPLNGKDGFEGLGIKVVMLHLMQLKIPLLGNPKTQARACLITLLFLSIYTRIYHIYICI